jgi:hypothetical protein
MRKKYFVRLIAALPMLAAAISMVVFLAMAFDNAWWVLLAIGDFWAFMRLVWEYDWSVRSVSYFLKEMANDALHE